MKTKEFLYPELEVLLLEEDIIATSGGEGIGEGDGDAATPGRDLNLY